MPLKILLVSSLPVMIGGRDGLGSGVGVSVTSIGANRCNRSSEIQR
jgi:hypothetical protein